MRTLKFAVAVLAAMLSIAGCDNGDDGAPGSVGLAGPAGPTGAEGPGGADATDTSISLSFLGRARNPDSGFDESAAEIVSFDAASQQAFVVNAESGGVDIYSLAAPTNPSFSSSIDVAADIVANVDSVTSTDQLDAVNSVDVSPDNDTVAVAIAADAADDNGFVAFYQTSDGAFLAAVEVGALPDMLMYSPDGNLVLVANEGEADDALSVNPEGSVSIIDVSGGESAATAASVSTVTFDGFNAAPPAVVRSNQPGATFAQDVEPEFIAMSADSSTAFVGLQENNAIAVVDVASATVSNFFSAGITNHRIPGNELDLADDDEVINIRSWPVFGMAMPDGIASYEVNGVTYVVTANEGDGRENFDDSIADATACDAANGFDFDADDGCLVFIDFFDAGDIQSYATIVLPDADLAGFIPDANFDGVVTDVDLAQDATLQDIETSITDGAQAGCDLSDGDISECVFTELYIFGGRSFSIINTETGERVFDSGSDFEVITADRLGADFNSDNDENQSGESRSNDAGPEPEAVTIGVIEGRTYAFIALERVGGIMVYDISTPETSSFVQYINTRDFSVVDVEDPANEVDLGPEGLEFVAAADSPNGNPLLLVSHEVSGTLVVMQIDIIQ